MSRTPKRQLRARNAKHPNSGIAINDALFRAAFRNSPAMHSIVRFSDAVLVDVNETFTRTLGYARDEVIGKTPFELNFWVAPERLHLYREQLATKGSVRDFEVEVRAKDGSIRTVLLSSEVVEIEGEAYSLSAGVDISKRKRSEKIQQATYQISEAAHAVENLGSLYAHIHEIIKGLMPADNFYIALFDPATELISFPYFVDERSENPGAFRLDTGLTGYVLRAGTPLLLDAAMNARKQRVGDKVTFKGFKGIRYVESGEPSATWLGVPLSIQGKSIGVMAVQDYRDGQAYGQEEKQILEFVATQTALAIERKKAEAELRASEARLREGEARFSTAFHATPVFTTIARLQDGKYVEVNDAFVRWVGLERAEIVGHNWQEFAMWPNVEDGAKFFAELQRTRSVRNVECQLRRRDGSLHTLLVSADIIEINREPHILGFALDVSEQKRAETELQNALAKERELSQLKSDFVSLVSHEFRTPLEIIMSSADNLERYHDRLAPEKREHVLRTIHKSVRRMSGMMEEVLVLGRLETDRMTFKPARFDLRAFCQRICDEIESATGKRCPIHLQLDSAPPDAFGDESVLRHIFTNLLSNAVKYSTPDQPVDFVVQRDGHDAVCRIVDRGCGIPEADQKRLFQAFHRGSNVRQIPGTGLGLLIVQRCVALHGAKIQFESVEGQGTTFTVRLPLFT